MYARLSGGDEDDNGKETSIPANFQSRRSNRTHGARSASVTELTPSTSTRTRLPCTSDTFDSESKRDAPLAARSSFSNVQFTETAHIFNQAGLAIQASGDASDKSQYEFANTCSAPTSPHVVSHRQQHTTHDGRHSIDVFSSSRMQTPLELETPKSSFSKLSSTNHRPRPPEGGRGRDSTATGGCRNSRTKSTLTARMRATASFASSFSPSPSLLRRKVPNPMTPVGVNTAADLKLNSKSGVTPLVVTNQPIPSNIPYRNHLANERTLLAWIRQAFGTWSLACMTQY